MGSRVEVHFDGVDELVLDVLVLVPGEEVVLLLVDEELLPPPVDPPPGFTTVVLLSARSSPGLRERSSAPGQVLWLEPARTRLKIGVAN